jgi:hypothetical protein
MKVRAVAALGIAAPDGVAAAPALSRFVVVHRGNNVVVDLAGLLNRRVRPSCVLLGKFGDNAGEWHQLAP